MSSQDFKWTSALSIGVTPMDRDHQKIINYMNALALASENGASFSELNSAFSKLNDFTRHHFQEEEAFMASIEYERLGSHKLIHQKLLAELDTHYKEFRSTTRVSEQVYRFLAFWLKSHICGIDRQYGKLVTTGG